MPKLTNILVKTKNNGNTTVDSSSTSNSHTPSNAADNRTVDLKPQWNLWYIFNETNQRQDNNNNTVNQYPQAHGVSMDANQLPLIERMRIFETNESTLNKMPKVLPVFPQRLDSLPNLTISNNRSLEDLSHRKEGSGTHSQWGQGAVNPMNIGWAQELYVESEMESKSSFTLTNPIPTAPKIDDSLGEYNAVNSWNVKEDCKLVVRNQNELYLNKGPESEPLPGPSINRKPSVTSQLLKVLDDSLGENNAVNSCNVKEDCKLVVRKQNELYLKKAPEPLPGPSNNSKPSVTSQLFNVLRRKTSSQPNADAHTVLEMVPKPVLTEHLISHQGHVLKFSTKWTPRWIELQNKILKMYRDPQKTKLKETLDLKCIVSFQSKLNIHADVDLYCVEVMLALPKNEISFSGNQHIKTPLQSITFGLIEQSERNQWMAKILQSVTDVFPDTCLTEFTRAGWCYMKKSMSSSWSGAWLLLVKRTLYFYNYQDRQLELLDLRKARSIAEIELNESVSNLHTEAGPTLFIDYPPCTLHYFIMVSPQETQNWKKIIQDTAHENGTSIDTLQLTNDEVPVMITKCIDFIYAHGSMSEWIYRKSGSSSKINKILQLFKEDSFAVQLSREEFNEHDVAGALKRFIRDMPDSLFGAYAISFISITSLKSTDDKISSYRELLSRLSKVEYQTLKKLIGHLSFIASLEKHNKMGVYNLAILWGTTLMSNSSQSTEAEQEFSFQNEAEVVADLIEMNKNLFPISSEDVHKEQQMLKVLEKYHSTAEDVSNTIKQSGDLKVWITIECDPETTRSETIEEKMQINLAIAPTKTASDICKEVASKTQYEWFELSLFEVICDDSLTRLVHYSERALEIILKWTYWNEADRRNNYLTVRPTTTLNDVFRHIQQAPLLSPTTELKFADQQTKMLRSYKLQLIGQEIGILKQLNSKKYEEVMTIHLSTVHAYLGRETKRDQSSLQWSITLVEHDFQERTRDTPFIGHILGGTDFTEQTLWYSSILHSLHPDDVLPSNDLRPTILL